MQCRERRLFSSRAGVSFRVTCNLLVQLIGSLTIVQLLCSFHLWKELYKSPIESNREFFQKEVVTHHEATNQFDNDANQLNLRFDWLNQLFPVSTLAKRLAALQSNCSLPVGRFRFRNRFGLGSDLHVYSQALCNALEHNIRVRTTDSWIWLDDTMRQSCLAEATRVSPFACYFPSVEPSCPSNEKFAATNITRGKGRIRNECPTIMQQYTIADIRAAAVEFIFASGISPNIVLEAKRQLRHVFSSDVVPSNLVTVHIRWGDKADEMELVSIGEYIRAIQEILDQRQSEEGASSEVSVDTVNVLLCTEDPEALSTFKAEAPASWNIYVDRYYVEMLPYRRGSQYNAIPLMAKELAGKPGLIALGSLLVAMEANDFVLTTSSNWSRLLNELRKNILDPRCGNCTKMIDLRPGEW